VAKESLLKRHIAAHHKGQHQRGVLQSSPSQTKLKTMYLVLIVILENKDFWTDLVLKPGQEALHE
jgi:hypothetical protein